MMHAWMQLDEELVYDGYRKIVRRNYQFPDGHTAAFEIKVEPLVVTIMAVTSEQTVVLAKQYRPGPGQVYLELPGGGVEPGEAPEAAARRELLEETGYAGDLHFIAEGPSGAYSTMRRYHFAALDCHKVADAHTDADELIDVVEFSLEDFRALLRSGQLTDVATGYLGLDFLGLL
jgi:ADP-ribose pyrophosphatase